MTTALDHPGVRAYLAELDRLLAGAADRDLVLDGVRQHIEESLGPGPAGPERVDEVLDELGDPAAIAAEASAAADAPPSGAATTTSFLERRSGAIVIVLLLTVGGFVVPLLGWLVGLVLLWSSRGWTVVDKVLATVGPTLVAAALVGLGAAVAVIAPDGPVAPMHLAVLAGFPLGAVLVGALLLRRFQEGGRQP